MAAPHFAAATYGMTTLASITSGPAIDASLVKLVWETTKGGWYPGKWMAWDARRSKHRGWGEPDPRF
jgi:hypothetical protein